MTDDHTICSSTSEVLQCLEVLKDCDRETAIPLSFTHTFKGVGFNGQKWDFLHLSNLHFFHFTYCVVPAGPIAPLIEIKLGGSELPAAMMLEDLEGEE